MKTIRERLLQSLPKDEELRYEYDEQFLNSYISTQIRVLREARKMTQTDLAKATKTGQSQISEMESDYGSWSLRTLRKLARAFGLRLFVTFESWGELIPRVEGFQRENLVRPAIKDDRVFRQDVARDQQAFETPTLDFHLQYQRDEEKKVMTSTFAAQVPQKGAARAGASARKNQLSFDFFQQAMSADILNFGRKAQQNAGAFGTSELIARADAGAERKLYANA